MRGLSTAATALALVTWSTGCPADPTTSDASVPPFDASVAPFDASDAALACSDAPSSDAATDGATSTGCETLRFRAAGSYRECAVGVDFSITRCGTEIEACTIGQERTYWCGPLYDAGAPGRFIVGGGAGRLFFDGPPSPAGGMVLYWDGRIEVNASYAIVR